MTELHPVTYGWVTNAVRAYHEALRAVLDVPWRPGRTNPANLYARTGGEDWKADISLGQLAAPGIAAEACEAHNALADIARLTGLEQLAGARWAVTFEYLPLARERWLCRITARALRDRRETEFTGNTIGEALAKAREWAETEGNHAD